MAKKQTRRSASLNRALFDAINEEAKLDGVSMSQWLTKLAKAELAKRGRPLATEIAHVSREIIARWRASVEKRGPLARSA